MKYLLILLLWLNTSCNLIEPKRTIVIEVKRMHSRIDTISFDVPRKCKGIAIVTDMFSFEYKYLVLTAIMSDPKDNVDLMSGVYEFKILKQ